MITEYHCPFCDYPLDTPSTCENCGDDSGSDCPWPSKEELNVELLCTSCRINTMTVQDSMFLGECIPCYDADPNNGEVPHEDACNAMERPHRCICNKQRHWHRDTCALNSPDAGDSCTCGNPY